MAKNGPGRPRLVAGALSLTTLLVGAWVLVMVATPIVLWTAGETAFPGMASLGVAVQAAASLAAARGAARQAGWRAGRLAAMALAVAGLAWGLEFVGQATGWPFGRYSYTAALQPQAGGVPLLIPLAWLMMLLPAWAVTQAILQPYQARLGRAYPVLFAALAGLAFTAWDLYLDPQMVSRGLWVWQQPGAYFGIPLQNYFGWWLGATLVTLAVRPGRLPGMPLRVIYIVTWLLQAIGLGVFWGQPGPALAGFVGMGIFVVWALPRQAAVCGTAGIEPSLAASDMPAGE